ncbi:MAG TPA: hypothetical protein P5548_00230 [Candidatus Moranbacteria bacterium]|nr:hypothetical protein [Candidatus Moranbacteria bacterium]HRZ33319.1 hypothetical protein [Candidatus Moranbacteria bacterium]
MDKKSAIFLATFISLIIISVWVTFIRIYVQKDYIIQNQIDCDPTVDACFIWECDPESTEEGEACTGDPEMDIWYYAVAQRKANMIPECDPDDENCLPFECLEGEEDCSVTFCDEITKEEQGVECNDPVQYNIDNPAEEEEESECAEDDEECLAAEEEAAECEEGDEECLAAKEEEADAEETAAEDTTEETAAEEAE